MRQELEKVFWMESLLVRKWWDHSWKRPTPLTGLQQWLGRLLRRCWHMRSELGKAVKWALQVDIPAEKRGPGQGLSGLTSPDSHHYLSGNPWRSWDKVPWFVLYLAPLFPLRIVTNHLKGPLRAIFHFLRPLSQAQDTSSEDVVLGHFSTTLKSKPAQWIAKSQTAMAQHSPRAKSWQLGAFSWFLVPWQHTFIFQTLMDSTTHSTPGLHHPMRW